MMLSGRSGPPKINRNNPQGTMTCLCQIAVVIAVVKIKVGRQTERQTRLSSRHHHH